VIGAAIVDTSVYIARRMPANDSWIAATALLHGLPVITQDDDYVGVPGLEVIRV
jgi:predicted nucleic acid-binding protein